MPELTIGLINVAGLLRSYQSVEVEAARLRSSSKASRSWPSTPAVVERYVIMQQAI